jgi:hypothetical protein
MWTYCRAVFARVSPGTTEIMRTKRGERVLAIDCLVARLYIHDLSLPRAQRDTVDAA